MHTQIMKHCTILAQFALRYAELQGSLPHVQPSPEDLDEMANRAREVMRLMDEYRRAGGGEFARVPKRPWEEIEDGGGVGVGSGSGPNGAGDGDGGGGADREQTTAEQDMEIIRTKRATSTAVAAGSAMAGAGAGQPKSKYRKRASGQRATPPGKCHSCNIRETPEWRRGPDGARTLCNACGLRACFLSSYFVNADQFRAFRLCKTDAQA